MVIDFCSKDKSGEIGMDDFCQTILQAQSCVSHMATVLLSQLLEPN